ncbi:arsenate reductase ArsC [Litoribacillus peritrichatus]|uniref:Arsenate reductase ArsC n=1 Tax=Litoribacillus peritrichatus TaxID=718191 RepID=A0ABP7MC89_9GAMM
MMNAENPGRPTILFLCVENSCRSQIAEAYAKTLLSDICDSYSSGSKPSGQVNPKAIASMDRAGYDMNRHTSKPIDELPTKRFDIAITMGCGDFCPDIKAGHSEDWAIPDPKHLNSSEFDQIRDQIKNRVEDLRTLLLQSA